MKVTKRRPAWSLPILASALLVGGCTDNTVVGDEGAGAIAVKSDAKQCALSSATAPSGNIVFEIANTGDDVTEFYVLESDGVGIKGEAENIGPGLTRRMVVVLEPGEYVAACKPGMVGDGIRSEFTVTDSGVALDESAGADVLTLIDTATGKYEQFVRDQASLLLDGTKSFAAMIIARDDEGARRTYANTRMYWERIEPVAESFGDLDPRLDLREADLAEGETWTGWHRLEKELWPPADDPAYVPLTDAERKELADQLVADTEDLVTRVADLDIAADQIGNGAKELMDEVATGKVTGEEEIWSHTDLWDFQANVDGARVAFEFLTPALEANEETDLIKTLTIRFDGLQALLDEVKEGDGFVFYDQLSAEQIRTLSDAVSALAEPLSTLTEAVIL